MGRRKEDQELRHGVLGHGNPAQYDHETIVAYLQGASVAPLQELGRAHAQARPAFQRVQQALAAHAKRLGAVWTSEAQLLSAKELRALTDSAGALEKASGQFETAMASAEGTIRTAQTNIPTPSPLGVLPQAGASGDPMTSHAADKQAQQHLAKTNSGLASAFAQIPTNIPFNLLSPIEDPVGGGPPPGATSGTGVPGLSPEGTPARHTGGTGPDPSGGGAEFSGPAGRTPGDLPTEEGVAPEGEQTPMPGTSAGAGASELQGIQPLPSGTSGGLGSPGLPSPTPATSGGLSTGGVGTPLPGGVGSPLPPRVLPAIPVNPVNTSGGSGAGPTIGQSPTGGRSGSLPVAGMGGGGVPRAGGVIGAPGTPSRLPGLNSVLREGPGSGALAPGGVIGTGPPGGGQMGARSGAAPGGEPAGARAGLGMPMGNGAGRRADSSYERSSSLSEDENVWAEDERLAPRVIGESADKGH